MCGFLFCFHKNELNFTRDDFINSLEFINHRGPDSSGYLDYTYNEHILRFGHKRLAINDLSENGNQPILSVSGRFVLIFNGEIYNHMDLRRKFKSFFNFEWKGNCDSETLVNLFDYLEPEIILKELSGQFSFVIFDKKNNKLIISRDIVGEKPLYLLTNDKCFAISSDLITFKNLKFFDKSISQVGFSKYLKNNYISAPNTIYNKCFKLPQSTFLEIELNKFILKNFNDFNLFIEEKYIKHKKYWQLKKNIIFSKDEDHVSNVKDILKFSVKEQLMSDVPLGVFLSGGIDSSLIASIASKNVNSLQTFNIGFEFNAYDESKYAKKIANLLGTKHTEYQFSKKDVFDNLPKINSAYTEPFADSSSLPTMLVSKIASKKVKVALSGDGGDELFGGYNRYIYAHKYWKFFNLLPKKELKFIANILHKILNAINNNLHYLIILRLIKICEKIKFINNEFTYYNSLTSEWSKEQFITDNFIEVGDIEQIFLNNNNLTFVEKMMLSDFLTYLPDDILCKVDRASMHNSLEVRAPFLNRKLIEYSYNLPFDFKIHKKDSKYVLRKILSTYIPKKYFDRPKQGFGIPLSEWIKGDIKELILDNLSEKNCLRHGLFNYNIVKKTLNNHFNNKENNQHKIWSLFQFNQWYESNF